MRLFLERISQKVRKKKKLYALVISLFNAEGGITIWIKDVKMHRWPTFLICSSIATAELFCWYFITKAMLYVIYPSIIFMNVVVNLTLGVRHRKKVARYLLKLLQELRQSKKTAICFGVIVAFFMIPHFFQNSTEDLLLVSGYAGAFLCGVIPSFILPGVFFLKEVNLSYGLLFFMTGNIIKIALFTLGWTKFFTFLDNDPGGSREI